MMLEIIIFKWTLISFVIQKLFFVGFFGALFLNSNPEK